MCPTIATGIENSPTNNPITTFANMGRDLPNQDIISNTDHAPTKILINNIAIANPKPFIITPLSFIFISL
jgi:hypothetical protein